ncbi:uncharacterized protein LOC111388817 [Olea europaea var. sylvestris]|uniref:uncharacterized protein LOC111388817 n=1 Tax=Olea europaea var. sylvestris TaxID=158386 RepID=UPI000C1CFFC6|nr:uncharacterized protein LOC111388817 [Olea europaea var. sylvestris]
MEKTSSGGSEGSSSNPDNPQQPDQSSPQDGGGDTSSPHADSSPLQRPPMAPPVMGRTGHSAFRAYRAQAPQDPDQSSPQRGSGSYISSPMQRPPMAPLPLPLPHVMGRPGHSAFRSYRPQSQPGGGGSSGGAAGASGNVSGSGLFGVQAIPVGGSGGGGGYAAGGVRIGNPMIRKRVREGNQGGRGDGGNPFQCSVCGKQFQSAKALFGHMRQHPDRGWKGAFPPPTFRAEEEFADFPGHLNPGRAAADVEQEAQAGEEAMEVQEGREEEGDGATGLQKYKLPDLNYEPPQDDDDAAA